jgi:hypothetical protein
VFNEDRRSARVAPNILNLLAIVGMITFDGLFVDRLGRDPLAEVSLVRLKEVGPDLLFTERFRWGPVTVEVSLDFWWDESVYDYWVGGVRPCGCIN